MFHTCSQKQGTGGLSTLTPSTPLFQPHWGHDDDANNMRLRAYATPDSSSDIGIDIYEEGAAAYPEIDGPTHRTDSAAGQLRSGGIEETSQ